MLKGALNQDEYEHFLTFFCAVTLCSSNIYKKYIGDAAKMFDDYVNNYIRIYGRHSITSNIHNLTHIADDMKSLNVGNLTDISSYRFENCLRLMGLKVKNCNLPLEQIVRRLIEASNTKNEHEYNLCNDSEFKPIAKHCYNLNGHMMFCKIAIAPGVEFSSKKNGDKWLLTKNGKIIQMKCAFQVDNTYKICGFELKNKNPFFINPINSTKLNIFESDGIMKNEDEIVDISSVFAKMFCLPFNSNFIFLPLLHSLDALNN